MQKCADENADMRFWNPQTSQLAYSAHEIAANKLLTEVKKFF